MPFDQSKIPVALIESFKQDKGGLFIGAGLSQSAGLPSWKGLLNDLIELAEKVSYSPNHIFIDNCKALLENPNKFLILAQELKDYLGDSFRKYIIEKYSDNCPAPTKDHLKIVSLPYKFILTTNYDILLENAYVKIFEKQAKVHTYKDSPDIAYDLWNNRQFILKAHGDANKSQQGYILTESDYRQIIFQEKGYQSILQSLFTTKTILFVGASLTDPELKLLLSFIHSSFHGGGPTHYALMPDNEMTALEAESWRRNFNIQIIPYSSDSRTEEVSEFICAFENLVNT